MTEKTIALIGNQNCGKTTLFNALTGANQYVGNWPGVTVDQVMLSICLVCILFLRIQQKKLFLVISCFLMITM